MVKFYIPKNIEKRLFSKSVPKNGCGSGWSTWLVPDNFLFWDFTLPCAIHDEMYAVGTTLADKDEADRVFLNNMLREANSKFCFIAGSARKMALVYYNTVVAVGGPKFWDNKNSDENMTGLKLSDGKITKES